MLDVSNGQLPGEVNGIDCDGPLVCPCPCRVDRSPRASQILFGRQIPAAVKNYGRCSSLKHLAGSTSEHPSPGHALHALFNEPCISLQDQGMLFLHGRSPRGNVFCRGSLGIKRAGGSQNPWSRRGRLSGSQFLCGGPEEEAPPPGCRPEHSCTRAWLLLQRTPVAPGPLSAAGFGDKRSLSGGITKSCRS